MILFKSPPLSCWFLGINPICNGYQTFDLFWFWKLKWFWCVLKIISLNYVIPCFLERNDLFSLRFKGSLKLAKGIRWGDHKFSYFFMVKACFSYMLILSLWILTNSFTHYATIMMKFWSHWRYHLSIQIACSLKGLIKACHVGCGFWLWNKGIHRLKKYFSVLQTWNHCFFSTHHVLLWFAPFDYFGEAFSFCFDLDLIILFIFFSI